MDNGYNGFPFPVFRIVSRRSAKHADSFADCWRAEYLRWRWPMRPANEQNRTASMDREYMDRICARHTGSGADHACLLRSADDRHQPAGSGLPRKRRQPRYVRHYRADHQLGRLYLRDHPFRHRIGRSRTDGGRAFDRVRSGAFDDDDRRTAGRQEHPAELRQRVRKPHQGIFSGHGYRRCRADVYL